MGFSFTLNITMKKYLLLFAIFTIALSSCKKSTDDTTATQAADDDAAIQTYMQANKITAIKDPSGLYYQVITPGTGAYPTSVSNVSVGYTGKLLDGTVFDTKSSVYLNLASGVVKGWQIGMQHINTGGTILLLIPSALGYGTAAVNSVPANSVLVFTVTLQGFN